MPVRYSAAAGRPVDRGGSTGLDSGHDRLADMLPLA
ncbi:hypothetical protein QFZ68_006235 [Streptomyces sp. V1I6]|nr:hypothetical protein [Streptomyces sp. V1I6]